MTVKNLTDFVVSDWLVSLSEPRMRAKKLNFCVNCVRHFVRCDGTLGRDVVVDILKGGERPLASKSTLPRV